VCKNEIISLSVGESELLFLVGKVGNFSQNFNFLKGEYIMSTLVASYEVNSEWDLDEIGINLDKVHDWDLKWNILNVQFEKDGEWFEYNPTFNGPEVFDYKYHHSLVIHNENGIKELDL